MKAIVLILFTCFAIGLGTGAALAGFGGARASGGSSSSRSVSSSARSSSFGGSRASVSPAPIIRPAPVYRSSLGSPSVTHNTTVIHHDSSPGFWSGMFMGSAMNRQPTIVVAQPGPILAAEPVLVESHSHWLLICLLLLLGGMVVYAVVCMRGPY